MGLARRDVLAALLRDLPAGRRLVDELRQGPGDVVAYSRGGFWALLTVALPGWVLMRVGGEWIRSKEGWSGDNDPAWLGIGYFAADVGFLVLLITILLAGLGMRQLRKTGGATNMFGRVATPFATILLVVYLIAVWAIFRSGYKIKA